MSTFNITEYSVEDQKKMLALLNRDKKSAERAKRERVRNTIMLQKAKAAKISVTDVEIDEYMKTM